MAKKKKTLRKKAEKELASFSIPEEEKPGKKDSFVFDPTKLTAKKLQRLYTTMVGWYCYANEQLAKVRVDLLEAEKVLRKKKAEFRFKDTQEKKWKQDSAMELDPQIRKAEKKMLVFEAKKILLEATVENYDRKSKALSREQTRRSVEYEKAGRV